MHKFLTYMPGSALHFVLCLAVLVPQSATALELGAIEGWSRQNEPLEAWIALHGGRSGDMVNTKATLGSPFQFETAGLERHPYLTSLEFTVIEQGSGRGHIRIQTREPVTEPRLAFLIVVDWPHGHIIHKYTLPLDARSSLVSDQGQRIIRRSTPLLKPPDHSVDPASTVRRTTPPPSTRKRAVNDGSPPSLEPSDHDAVVAPTAEGTTTAPSAASSTTSGDTYGPVRAIDTLWSLATQLRPDKSISIHRMMLALLEANPLAFSLKNVNGLHSGAILKIPARDAIGAYDEAAAVAAVQEQNSAWETYLAGLGSPASAKIPEDALSAAGEQAKGRVEVISSVDTGNAGPASGETTDVQVLRSELILMTEEMDATRLENEELTSRLTAIEHHLEKLNQLIVLKNDEIAALKTQAPTMTEGEVVAVDSISTLTEPVAEIENEPGVGTIQSPTPPETQAPLQESVAARAPEPESSSAPEPEPASAPEAAPANGTVPGFLVGAIGALLAVLGLGVAMRRRGRSPRPSIDESDSRVERDPAKVKLGDHRMQGALSDRPVANAAPTDTAATMRDLGSSHGDRGEMFIGAAGSVHPDRVEHHIKLLNLYHTGGHSVQFEKVAMGLSTIVGIGDPMMLRVAALWNALGTGRALFAGTPFEYAEFDITEDAAGEDAEPDLGGNGAPPEVVTPAEDATTDPGPVGAAPIGAAPVAALIGAAPVAAPIGATPIGAAPVDTAPIGAAPVDNAPVGAAMPAEAAPAPFASDFGDPTGDPKEAWFGNDVQTKIDLAQAYIEMGDTDDVRQILDEVLIEGNADQREIARTMLWKLN